MALGKSPQVTPAPAGESITPASPETKTEAWGRGSHRGGWALAPPTPRPPSPQHAGHGAHRPRARLAVALSLVLHAGRAKGWAGASRSPRIIRTHRSFLRAS